MDRHLVAIRGSLGRLGVVPRVPPGPPSGRTLLDALVGVALVALLAGTALPAVVGSARERANRIKCASNLRQIGQGMLLYANDNNGALPRVRYDDGGERGTPTLAAYTNPLAKDPFADDGPKPNDVTAALFLLVRNADLSLEVFVCPSAPARRWEQAGRSVTELSNFPAAQHLSYGIANPYPSKAAVARGYKWMQANPAEFAQAADMNPGDKALTALTARGSADELKQGNSLNHAREGQNVLYADGHVDWSATAFAGVQKDNIYTFGAGGDEAGGTGIVGSPLGAGDSVILPIAAEGGGPATRPTTRPAADLPRTAAAWTIDEAMAHLRAHPRDPYVQYVALQLSRREGVEQGVVREIEEMLGRGEDGMGGRREDVDLFSLFTGALAVQESLQLDTMRGEEPRAVRARREAAAARARWEASTRPAAPAPAAAPDPGPVPLAKLTGPTIRSHPWEKMLAGRRPEVSKLSAAVPEDFYLAEFRSLSRLLEAADTSDLWSTQLLNQAVREARTQQVGERLKSQLAIQTNPLLRPFYDQVVDEVAIAGSDLFLREGSDATMLFHVTRPAIFRGRMDGFLADAAKSRPDAKREEGNLLGVPFTHVSTPDRAICVYSAYPSPELHVRSNSRPALERILRTIQGQGQGSLAGSLEFRYIRTLMPRGAAEEDGLLYLSDPFIRRLVGPRVKLTERRRVLCYNHLKMIGHAATMYQTEYGRRPASLAELERGGCAPGTFGNGRLACPDGGTYGLAAFDTGGAGGGVASGTCSVHGHAAFMTPVLEVPLEQVSAAEAEEYRWFLEEYNQYWRTYFDPIAVRVQAAPQRLRVETIVLPLLDNSIYTGMARALGGVPEPLDALPVPERTIFSTGLKFNKEALLKELAKEQGEGPLGAELFPEEADQKLLEAFLVKGIGNQVGFHVYDSAQAFDFSLPEFLGMAMGTMDRGGGLDADGLVFVPLIASLNAPVYLSIPIRDAKVADDFLAALDRAVAAQARVRLRGEFGIEMAHDYFRLPAGGGGGAGPAKGDEVRCYALKFGPFRWRIFWRRIGDALYIASKPFILDDLAAAAGAPVNAAGDADATAHALVRLRPQNWDRVLGDYRLGWAENNRLACLENLGPLSGVARLRLAMAGKAGDDPTSAAAEVLAHADRLHGVHFFCPESGRYALADDGKSIRCAVHGTALTPVQPTAPQPAGELGELLRDLRGMTAALTFTEEGLRAVVTIERK